MSNPFCGIGELKTLVLVPVFTLEVHIVPPAVQLPKPVAVQVSLGLNPLNKPPVGALGLVALFDRKNSTRMIKRIVMSLHIAQECSWCPLQDNQ